MFDPDEYELHEAQKHACKMARERDEARVMVDKLTAELAACAAVLPGAYYMDPPDGGDVPVAEQLQRMAQDAELLREALKQARHAIYHGNFTIGWNIDRLDDALIGRGVGNGMATD